MLKKDLTENELSMFTFFRFYIKSKDELLIKRVNTFTFRK